MKNADKIKYMTDDELREIWERIGKDEEDWQKWLAEEVPEECTACHLKGVWDDEVGSCQ